MFFPIAFDGALKHLRSKLQPQIVPKCWANPPQSVFSLLCLHGGLVACLQALKLLQ